MIKLMFQLARIEERVYESARVVIGLGSSDLADLPFDASTLQAEHVVIVDSDGEFWAINQANDPFVTVNGRPFGRKLLRNGDRLVVADVAIGFEGQAQSKGAMATIVPMLERKIHEHQLAAQEQLTSQATRLSQRQALDSDHEVVALLQEVEALTAPSPSTPRVIPSAAQQADRELFDALLSEASSPDPTPTPSETTSGRTTAPHPSSTPLPAMEREKRSSPSPDGGFPWNTWLIIGSAILLLLFLLGLGIFAAVAEQSDQQEYIAAKNVADVAMALSYAQMHHAKPQNQNWTDPEFIASNIDQVLNGLFDSTVHLDAQGYIKGTPYLLRIYTNHDASQFLLMAQPVFSLWHWFSRQHTILLDSTAMELRRTSDLRALNRLIVHPNALMGSNALEVSRLVREAELVPLKAVARETHHREFIAPRELKVLRPGAENLIHNAPRYYRLGEPVVDALAKMNREGMSETKEVADRIQQLQRLSRLVLYTSQGKTTAKRALWALKDTAPNENILVGYLTFQPETGDYASSQLLPDEIYTEKN